MKNRLITFFSLLTAIGLFLVAATETTCAQAQPTQPPLVTVNPNAPAAQSPTASGFVLKPVGIVREVEKLTQSGADPAVVKAFIQSWRTPYSISADEILRLHAVGVPSDALTALIQHGAELSASVPGANMSVATPPPVPYPGQTPPISQPSSPAPPVPDQYAPQPTYPVEPPVVYSYPAYPYDYGYYSGYPWPYYYYPGVSIGLGFGFRGRGGFHGGFGGRGEHGGFGGHGGSFGGHGGSFGGHGGGFGGRSGGGHR